MANHLFVVGGGGNFWHSSDGGSSWSQITTGLSDTIYSVWGTSLTDIYLGTTYGKIYHYDGATISLDHTLIYNGASNVVTDIHGNSDGSEIWVSIYRGGAPSTVYCAKKVSGVWTEYESGFIYTRSEIIGGIGYTNIVSLNCTSGGAYYIYDPRTSTNLQYLFNETTFHFAPVGIRETSSDVIFVVGPDTGINKLGKIYRGDSTSWTLVHTATQNSALRQVNVYSGNQLFVSPTDNIWIAGEDYITNYNGSTWTENSKAGTWCDCHGVDDNNIWFLDYSLTSNHLVKWNGSSFDAATTISSFNPYGIWTYREAIDLALFNLRNLTMHNDDESTFATTESGYSGRQIQCQGEVKVDIQQEFMEDESIHSYLGGYLKDIAGLKNKTKINFTTYFRSTGTAAGNSTEQKGAADHTECQLWDNFLGTETKGTGTTCTTSSTSTVVKTNSAAGIAANTAILVNGEARPVYSKDTNDLTVAIALTSAPAENDVVYASTTYDIADALTGSLQLRSLTGEDDYWALLGGQVTKVTLKDMGPGQVPKIDWELGFASWTKGTGGSVSAASFDNSSIPPIPGNASKVLFQQEGTTTLNYINVSSISVDMGMDITQLPTVGASGGIQGVQSYVRQGRIRPTFELTTTDWDSDLVTAFTGQAAYRLFYQIGSTAGSVVCIDLSNSYINNIAEESVSGQLGMKIQGYCIGQYPVRIHLL